MKASELIEELQKQIDNHGDIDVRFIDYYSGVYFEIDSIFYTSTNTNGKFIAIE